MDSNYVAIIIIHQCCCSSFLCIQIYFFYRFNGIISGTGAYTQTAGQTINNGIMTQSYIAIFGGILSGYGTINGTVVIDGGANVQPGISSSPGTLTINGNLYSNSSSVNYMFRIGGTRSSGLYDVLKITNGTATFTGGNVNFSFINGYKAVAGDSWDFILADYLTGYNTLNFSVTGLDSGLSWEVDPSANGETLLITPTAMPIPSTFALLGTGLLGLLGWARRIKVV
jgi:hypothetical protein